MIQVSMVGFAVGGAFLSLLYYDVPYYLIAIVVSTAALVEKALACKAVAARPAMGERLAPAGQRAAPIGAARQGRSSHVG
jgi:putative inorganic carbon (HCO3(-)) transporter